MLALFPEIAAAAQGGDLEKLSVLIRTYFAADEATKPRLDAAAVVRQFGIPIGIDSTNYFGAIGVRDVSGNIRASIMVRDQLTPEQKSFLLCHLLGHFVLHVQPVLARGEWKTSGFRENVDPVRRYAFGEGVSGISAQDYAAEDLADRFAGALLMPAAMFRRAMEKLQDPIKVAAVFGVTKETVERRIDDLGTSHPVEALIRAGARTAVDGSDLNPQRGVLTEVPPEQLIRDVNQPVAATPRAVAAHSYSDAAQTEPKTRKPSGGDDIKGMARLRELARKMDRFGDKTK